MLMINIAVMMCLCFIITDLNLQTCYLLQVDQHINLKDMTSCSHESKRAGEVWTSAVSRACRNQLVWQE